MPQLAQSDLEAALGFVRRCEEFSDFKSLRSGLLRELRPLIPYDSALYMEVVPGTLDTPARWMQWTLVPEEAAAVVVPDAYRRWEHQHPAIMWYRTNKGGPALRLADFISQRQFHRLELYDAFYRLIGVEHQMTMAFRLSDHEAVGLPLNRAERGFSDRDRDMLNLLRPHIAHLHRRVRERAFAQRALHTLGEAASETGRAVVLLGRGDEPEVATGSAPAWLRDYFPEDTHHAGLLPATLAEWLRAARRRRDGNGSGHLPEPPAPLVARENGGSLVVSFLPAAAAGEPDALMLEQRRHGISPKRARALGLTAREGEVLGCAARGMTDIQIANEFGVSPRTVQKHLEHVYAKLGVPSRTAAVAKVRDEP